MAAKRHLIVNADDFGLGPGVNKGVIEAHEQGIVTSASLMVRWPAAPAAADYGREHPGLSLGLHVDLCEWTYCNGNWLSLYEVIPMEDRTAVMEEIFRQVDIFRCLTGQDPTHIDSHQHVHLVEPAHSVLVQLASDLGIPLRHCSPEISYCGSFYGQTAEGLALQDAISVHGLLKILAELPPGVTELACHPGVGDDLETMYRRERAQEVRVLCDPRVRAAIVNMGLVLCSFGNYTNLTMAGTL
jgi:predicted glycoside hydrolase/deacetylase ChbG (UPF0249 family)